MTHQSNVKVIDAKGMLEDCLSSEHIKKLIELNQSERKLLFQLLELDARNKQNYDSYVRNLAKNITETKADTQEDVYQRCLQLGVNVGMPDFCDINWLKLNSDAHEFFEGIFKILEDERNVVLYFMHHKMHVEYTPADTVVTSESSYKVTVLDERCKRDKTGSCYYYDSLDKVCDLALIWGKGAEGIHDYGKYNREAFYGECGE